MADLYYLIRVSSILWMGMMLALILFGQPNSKQTTVADKSRYFISITLSGFLTAVLYLTGDYESRLIGVYQVGVPYLNYAGLALIALGLMLHIAGLLTLKEEWSVEIKFDAQSHIVKRGIYGLIRHPIYTAILIELAGFCIALSNWLSLFLIFIPNCISFMYRTIIEECELVKQFGDEYLQYMKQTKRFIPFLI